MVVGAMKRSNVVVVQDDFISRVQYIMKSFLSRNIPVLYWATSILKDLLHNYRRDFYANCSIGGLKFVESALKLIL